MILIGDSFYIKIYSFGFRDRNCGPSLTKRCASCRAE